MLVVSCQTEVVFSNERTAINYSKGTKELTLDSDWRGAPTTQSGNESRTQKPKNQIRNNNSCSSTIYISFCCTLLS